MRKTFSLVALFQLVFTSALFAQISVTVNNNGPQLAQVISGPGVIINNVTINSNVGQAGTFRCANCSLGMDSGIVLTNGKVDSIPGPNRSPNATWAWGTAGDANLATQFNHPLSDLFDACVLEFDLTVQSDSIQFKYIFGSEEYPQFVCSPFNDCFAFFISGPGITGLKDIALIPGTTIPVAINAVNSGHPGGLSEGGTCDSANQSLAYSQYYVNNGTGDSSSEPYYSNPYYIQYNGFTTTLTAGAGGLTPCSVYHLKLAIADVADPTYDSGVFIQANSLSSNLVTLDTAGSAIPGLEDTSIRGCVDGIFTLKFQKPVTQATTVNYTIGGTAVNGTDYTAISGSAQFAAGDSTQQVIIHPIGTATQTQSVILYLTSGCGTVYDTSVLYIITPPQLVAGPDTTVCPGDSVHLQAALGATTYSWGPNTNISATNISNPYAFPTTTTTYTCTATALGCASTASVTVTVYTTPPFSVNAGPNVTACGGGTVQLNAVVTGMPINGQQFVYNWVPTTGLTNPNIANPVDASTTNTSYIVFVTSGHCSASDTIDVIIDSVTANMASTMATCSYSATGTATATVTAGTAPYTYSWSSGSTSATASNLAPALYSVTITDNSTCTVSDTITVYGPAPIIFGTPTTTSVSCLGGNNGTATVSATGGTGPITFSWSSGSTTATATNLTANTYTVTATDASSCTATTTVQVSTLTPVATTIATTNVLCFGGSTGTATANSTGGTTPYSYSWSNTSTANPITALITGPYSVTTTDNAGCTTSASATVGQQPLLTVTEISSNITCFNARNGTITLSINGGTTPYSYSWSDGNVQENRNNLDTGTYNVTVTDANTCTATAGATLTEPTPLVMTETAVNVTCYGGSNGSIDLTVTGGAPPYQYNWGIGVFSQNATNLPVGYYYPTVTDNNGCIADTVVQITSPGQIVFPMYSTTPVSCFGLSDGIVQVYPQNTLGTVSYTWNNVAGNNPDSSLAAGTYNVIVTDSNNCTASQTVVVTQPTPLTLSITGQNALCYNGADGSATDIVAGGTQPYNYVWSDGQRRQIAVVLSAGTYQSTVTDNNGCSATSSVTISQPGQILYTVDSTAVKCIGSDDGTLTLNVTSGGVPPFTYAATQNSTDFITTTDSVIEGLATGYYQVQVSDANGCVVLDTAYVPNAIPDSFSIVADSTSCFGPQYTDGQIQVAGLVQQNSPYQYSVDGGVNQFSGDFTNLAAGTHHISITNFNGCVTDTTAVVGEPIAGLADIYPADTTLQLGQSVQLFSSFTNYPTSAIVSYNWVPSTGLSCIDCPAPMVSTYSHINNYTLTITYNSGCVASASAQVIITGTPPVFIPNSFTPNGDGNNDVFLIYGEDIKTVSLKIFDRWGEKVFDSGSQFNGWDGTYKGLQQPPAVYVYEAQITFLDNTQTLRTGSITLIR